MYNAGSLGNWVYAICRPALSKSA